MSALKPSDVRRSFSPEFIPKIIEDAGMRQLSESTVT
jgi:hypothetical protein